MAHCQGHLPLAETVTAFRLPDWSPLCRDVTVARRRCAPSDWLACVMSLSSQVRVSGWFGAARVCHFLVAATVAIATAPACLSVLSSAPLMP